MRTSSSALSSPPSAPVWLDDIIRPEPRSVLSVCLWRPQSACLPCTAGTRRTEAAADPGRDAPPTTRPVNCCGKNTKHLLCVPRPPGDEPSSHAVCSPGAQSLKRIRRRRTRWTSTASTTLTSPPTRRSADPIVSIPLTMAANC